jgi:hypothetical protein
VTRPGRSRRVRFQVRADDAFVLNYLLNQHVRILMDRCREIAARVAGAVENPALTLPFVLVAGAEPLLALARSRDAVEAALGRLRRAVGRKTKMDLRPSTTALDALKPPVAGFTVSRTLVDKGRRRRRSGGALRERNIVFRSLRHSGEEPLFEWSEVSRRQLRRLWRPQ